MSGAAPMALWAGADHDHQELPASSPQFERMKRLVGTWEGSAMNADPKMKDQKVIVEYSLTSGGSALVEKLFPGTPHEMISVYHDRKGKLSMTHYCMLKNQPLLEMKSWKESQIEFDLSKDSGIDLNEECMRSLVVDFQGDDQITQNWTSYVNNKKKETSSFMLKRVKAK